MLWMLLVALVEIYTDYLFQVLELIMENSLWRTWRTAIWNRLPKALYSAKTVNGFKTLFCTM